MSDHAIADRQQSVKQPLQTQTPIECEHKSRWDWLVKVPIAVAIYFGCVLIWHLVHWLLK